MVYTGETENRVPNQPEDVYSVAQLEVAEISKLLPPKGLSAEQRRGINSVVRDRLGKASDIALVWLARGHDLSFRELRSRLKDGRVVQPQALFEIMMPVPDQRIDYFNDKMFTLAYKLALTQAPDMEGKDLVQACARFITSGNLRDSDWFEDILARRADVNSILDQALTEEGVRPSENFQWVRERIEGKRKLQEVRDNL